MSKPSKFYDAIHVKEEFGMIINKLTTPTCSFRFTDLKLVDIFSVIIKFSIEL